MNREYFLKSTKLLSFQNFKNFKWQATIFGILTLALLILLWQGFGTRQTSTISEYTPPLAMKGGDPVLGQA